MSFTERFLALTSLRQLKKGEFAHHLGDGPGSFYGIVSGALIVLVPMVPQGVQHGHLSLPGHWFGVAAALTETNRHVALEAAIDTTLLTIPGQAVTALLADTPAFTRHILGLVLANQLIAIRTAADLLIQEPRDRLVARLLTLSGLKLGERASHSSCDLPLTQDQLAAMCCLSRNSVNRMLSELEHRGLVQQKYGMVHLSDRFELEATLN
ncbi:MAG: Crp/Fnr family transcriptional regulator [Alphaproteobacteria bacterium]|nr:Crp/Fnr family transcriptional regulator [Alphaproteobacteria bacterium]